MFRINSNKVACYDEELDISITYDELNRLSKIKFFKEKKKLIVLILCENSMGCFVSYFCSIQNNNTTMLINSQISKKELASIKKKFNPDLVIIPSRLEKKFIDKNLYKKKIFFDFTILKNREILKKNIDSKIVLLLSTSGTTGTYKWTKISNENLISNISKISKKLNLCSSDSTITTLPFEYSYGLSVINSHIFSKAKIIFTKKSIVEKSFWEILKNNKITNFNGVPFSYEILEKINFGKIIKNSSLKFFTQAGGSLNANLHKKIYSLLNSLNIKFYPMYGATEAGPRITIAEDNGRRKNFKTIGKPLKNYKLIIIKNNKIIDKPQNTGNIFLKSDSIFGGYAESYKDLSKFEKIHLLDLKDIGFFDKENNFYISGRSGRISKIKGVRINLDILEKKLEKINNRKIAIVSDDKKIFIFVNKKNILLKSDVIKNVNVHNSDLVIREILEIPYNKRGKKDYKKLLRFI